MATKVESEDADTGLILVKDDQMAGVRLQLTKGNTFKERRKA